MFPSHLRYLGFVVRKHQLKKRKNMPKCPHCGAQVDADAKFCGECGESTSQVKQCVQCEKEIPVKAKFCKYCGFDQDKDPFDWTPSPRSKSAKDPFDWS